MSDGALTVACLILGVIMPNAVGLVAMIIVVMGLERQVHELERKEYMRRDRL